MAELTRLDELHAEIVMGDDARKFLESDIGRFVLARADEEKQEAMLKLAIQDAEDPRAIRELQNVVRRANDFALWLVELIQRGSDAEKILLAERDEDGRRE